MRTRLSLLLLFGCLWPAAAQAQQPVTIVGQKTPNTSAPTALRNLPVMPAIACSTGQSYTAGRVVFPCTNLFGYVGIFLTDPNTGAIVTLATDPTHDAPAATSGPQVMGECDDVATDAVDEGDAARLRVDCTNRQLYVRQLDPCSGIAKIPVPFSISTATTTQLVAASASNKVYVCSVFGVTAGANNIALVEDDTSACASPTAGMSGGVTAASGWNFGANGGLVAVGGNAFVAATAATNRYVCFITSASTQFSGTLVYALAP